MTAVALHPDGVELKGEAHAPHTAALAECSHCRLPVPPGLFRSGAANQFCCHGCETAFTVINGCNLGNYYKLLRLAESDSDAMPVRPPRSTRRAYAEFDDPTFQSLYCRAVGERGAMRTEFLLEGVHCAACVWLVERLPQVAPGVLESRLDIRRAAVQITFDPARIALSMVARTLESLGYAPHPARAAGSSVAKARQIEDRRALVRLAVAGACAGNIMLLFFALYAGMFEGMERGYEQMFRWIAMGLNTLCLAWPGTVFARSALAAIRTRTIHLDVPIALGLFLGGGWGIWKTIAGTFAAAGGTGAIGVAGASDIYFDSISALVFFLLVGRFVQQRQQRSASDAVGLLFSVTPTVARRVGADGSVTDVPTEALVRNEIIEIRAGDSAPADGVIIEGESSVDLSLLTGESRPIHLGTGNHIAAGAVNLTSPLRVRVEAAGEETRVGKLMRIVEDAARRRAAIVRQADRWGAWLLWILLGLAACTLAIWWHAGAAVAIDHAAALLIATCPCGLGLATPLVMTVALGRGARCGMLIKGGDVLEALASRDARRTIVLDKTGTITLGRLAVVRWYGEADARPLVAALEEHSSHPAAIALTRDLSDPASDHLEAGEVIEHRGAGMEGAVAEHCVLVGTRALFECKGVEIPADIEHASAEALHMGLSPVYVAVDGACVGLASLGDPIRPDAAAAINALRSRGWSVTILSGDHPDVVNGVACVLGLDSQMCRAGVTPEQKLEVIRELVAEGPTVMVGDGVNDAAALAAATVGIAVRGGAEASLAAADVSLSREGLRPVVDLLDGAQRTMRTIHWTIASSLAYNVVAASLSMAGLISPLLAAFIMPASSLTVLAIAIRSGAFRPQTANRSGGSR